MLLVVLLLQWKCIWPSFAGQVLLQSLCSLCCCVFKTLDICRQAHGKQHTSLHLLAERYGVQFLKPISHGILQVQSASLCLTSEVFFNSSPRVAYPTSAQLHGRHATSTA